uniref:Uncharacterized protein n=1 Tax=Oryza sativa subsp. japonica TaxID=39947 RepID=Q6Z7R4_ORYSJ|nr:hypothetical protein [Oryza sativa Japonica Group]BAD15774.1 hypothetical protein [Oryza sativa Japonica Group]
MVRKQDASQRPSSGNMTVIAYLYELPLTSLLTMLTLGLTGTKGVTLLIIAIGFFKLSKMVG